jgi:hypothetical protein
MKPLFTIHAGEFLVGEAIERKFPKVNVWVPAKDTGVDLLVSDAGNERAVSLQVKFSRDYLEGRDFATHMKDEIFRNELRALGWWTLTRHQIETSPAKYWVFVLAGFVNKTTDFIIIERRELLKRLDGIHQGKPKFQCYFCVTNGNRCWDTRGLKKSDVRLVAEATFKCEARDFTTYLDNWRPIEALNG